MYLSFNPCLSVSICGPPLFFVTASPTAWVLNPHGRHLVLGDLGDRVEGAVGEQVGRRLHEVEGHEDRAGRGLVAHLCFGHQGAAAEPSTPVSETDLSVGDPRRLVGPPGRADKIQVRVTVIVVVCTFCDKGVAIAPEEIGGIPELVTNTGDMRSLPNHLADAGGLDGFFATRLRRHS